MMTGAVAAILALYGKSKKNYKNFGSGIFKLWY